MPLRDRLGTPNTQSFSSITVSNVHPESTLADTKISNRHSLLNNGRGHINWWGTLGSIGKQAAVNNRHQRRKAGRARNERIRQRNNGRQNRATHCDRQSSEEPSKQDDNQPPEEPCKQGDTQPLKEGSWKCVSPLSFEAHHF
jgi:hypothetical protein